MSYSKPIWNEVQACKYKNPPSWGGFDDVSTTTVTGSSRSNSQELAKVDVSRKFYENLVAFNFYLDGKLVKQNINARNGERAGVFLQQRKRNFLNSENESSHPVNKKLK